ncbi:M16 family metallopeptidase [Pararhodospirillum photometricum]|uniref:Hypothetical protease n=1 Tax=Pararhodospirillum photometricum DSM 122 TaxID=1150469 RepID=H6SJU3_PARPM|nr:pitrilysin family protein [Pararhodospirillum photometricum]CCG08258.1 Hypothetical protease [Pararhodospirillum photometricum DSM 122]
MKPIHLARALGLVGLIAALGMAPCPASALQVETLMSPRGVGAYLVSDDTLPVVSLQVLVPAGSAYDPPGKEGLATLVARLLDEGAGDLDAQAFQQRLEDLAIDLSFDPGRDYLSISLRTTTETLDEAVHLLALALTQPRFDPEAVERMRAGQLATVRHQGGDPQALANQAWFKAVFDDHPYAHDEEGTEASVRALTIDDIRDFARARLARKGLAVGIAGAIDARKAATVIDRIFGALPLHPKGPALPPAAPRFKGETEGVVLDIPQSTAILGQPGLLRSDPDWHAAYVLNHILGGGGFSSRLMDEVREKRGLAYSVASFLYPLEKAGVWMATTATESSRLPESLAVIKAEWARLAQEGPTEEEVQDAKTALTGAWPLRLTSTQSVAGMLASMRLYELGADYIQTRNAKIEALTRDDLARVARRLMDPERLSTVVVGPADVLKGK